MNEKHNKSGRHARLAIRVNARELAQIQQAARREFLPASAFVRRLALQASALVSIQRRDHDWPTRPAA